jgi:hypothetical protein
MGKKTKTPRGLLEFEGSLHDLQFMPELIARLRDLPGHKFDRDFETVDELMQVIASAEQAALMARAAARAAALRIWEEARKRWPIKILQEVTGYDDDD